MATGVVLRGLLGPLEPRAATLYRAAYFDLDRYAAQIADWASDPRAVLEIGCGEGAVTERLVAIYPRAEIVATDISPRLGRLYRGPADRVRFLQDDAAAVATARPASFDLALFTDALHHVPLARRRALIGDALRALRPGGLLIVKEWERRPTPIHWACYASDRWLTGDRIAYMRREELRALLDTLSPRATIVGEARFRPWRNNLAFAVAA